MCQPKLGGRGILIIFSVVGAVTLPALASQADRVAQRWPAHHSVLDERHGGPAERPLQTSPADCPVELVERTVRGHSLEPLLHHGQAVTIVLGYYRCHPVARGDVVMYRFAGNRNPLLKIVAGIPGDRFTLQEVSEGGRWHLIVNGAIAHTADGTPYAVGGRGYRMLSMYVRDYRGAIPEQAYLLLGNRPRGSLDSTAFGLVSARGFLGKAVMPSVSSVPQPTPARAVPPGA